MYENAVSCLARGLPEAQRCKPHGRRLSVAAGGPSLADTYQDLDGTVVAVNGSLGWLLDRDVTPFAVGIMDPGEHMADLIRRHPKVLYFVASVCDPSLFDHLEGCNIYVWHPSPVPGLEQELRDRGGPWMTVGGASTMGVRWLNLGYTLGFRRFALHGIDSSFRDQASHAYPDKQDGRGEMVIDGHLTKLNFLAQVTDFFRTLERFSQTDMDPVGIEVYGDGLLPMRWRKYRDAHPEAFRCPA